MGVQCNYCLAKMLLCIMHIHSAGQLDSSFWVLGICI